jgi:endogenous inhibitor of DNA gyrase (YacG/DUF329 family)
MLGRVDSEDLRLAVYRTFRDTGQAPELSALARDLGSSETDVSTGLQHLARSRHLALDSAGAIVMAHPFSAVPLGFSLMAETTLWWGGCAWDSFALPHLLGLDSEVLVATRCPACSTPHAWSVGTTQPPDGDQVAHFLVPAAHMWDDVVFTCSNQRIFCSRQCVDDWLDRTGHVEGYVMALPTLWALAAHWYEGRLERDYVRREPAAAQDYMRSVGLSGPFWGL